METVEEKVEGKSFARKGVRGGLRVAFHPTGIRDFVRELISYTPQEPGESLTSSEAYAYIISFDVVKYIIYAGVLMGLYEKLR